MDNDGSPVFRAFVHGIPSPQGSKRHVGRGIMVESCKTLPQWRDSIRTVSQYVMLYPAPLVIFTGPVFVELLFTFPRPKSHYGTGAKSCVLKSSAPHWKQTKPDIDKLERAVLDSLSHIVFRDDAQVVRVVKEKSYGDKIGVSICVKEAL